MKILCCVSQKMSNFAPSIMMRYLGELISLGVAMSWTVAALASEVGSRRLGVLVMNVWRMALALLLSALLMWAVLGAPYPVYAGGEAWAWLLASGVVGYFFGDWCLFNSYLTIGSRMGQLFMTLAPMFTALSAWVMLGQRLSWTALLAMGVTLLGIAISVLGRNEEHHVALNLPLKGVLFGIGAGLGQGVGLVLSKLGLDCYEQDVPSGHGSRMRESLKERRGLLAMIVAVFSGPFIGVGFSLMAVQYTAAGIASTIMAMTPIIILLPSKWLFGQPITVRAVVGAVISVVGVSLFFLL